MTKECETKLLACGEASVALRREDTTGEMVLSLAAEGADVRVMSHGGAVAAFNHCAEGGRETLVVLVPEDKPLRVKAELHDGATLMTLAPMASLDVQMRGGGVLEAGKAAQVSVRADGGAVSLVSCGEAEIDATGVRVSAQGTFGALSVRGDEATTLYSRAGDGVEVSAAVRVLKGSDRVGILAPPSPKAISALVLPLRGKPKTSQRGANFVRAVGLA